MSAAPASSVGPVSAVDSPDPSSRPATVSVRPATARSARSSAPAGESSPESRSVAASVSASTSKPTRSAVDGSESSSAGDSASSAGSGLAAVSEPTSVGGRVLPSAAGPVSLVRSTASSASELASVVGRVLPSAAGPVSMVLLTWASGPELVCGAPARWEPVSGGSPEAERARDPSVGDVESLASTPSFVSGAASPSVSRHGFTVGADDRSSPGTGRSVRSEVVAALGPADAASVVDSSPRGVAAAASDRVRLTNRKPAVTATTAATRTRSHGTGVSARTVGTTFMRAAASGASPATRRRGTTTAPDVNRFGGGQFGRRRPTVGRRVACRVSSYIGERVAD